MESSTYGKQLFTKQQCRKLVYIICFHWVLTVISDGINSDFCWILTVLQCRLSKTLPVQRDLGILIVSSLEDLKKKKHGYWLLQKHLCGSENWCFQAMFSPFLSCPYQSLTVGSMRLCLTNPGGPGSWGFGTLSLSVLKIHLWGDLRPKHIFKTNQKVLYFIRSCNYEVNIQEGWRARQLVQ